MNRSVLLGKLTPFTGQRKLIVNDQQVNDIVSAMLSAHKIYQNEYDKISEDFYSGNDVQTAKKVFEFLKKNVKYKVESENNQRIMSPSAIVSLGKNDCKNYALFIAGVLDSLKRKGLFNSEIFYRFASYRLLDEVPHHVFVVIKDQNGNEHWIDPVLNKFNDRKTYFHKIDKKVNGMPLYSVSGIGNAQVGLFGSKKRKKQYAAAVKDAQQKGLPIPAKPVRRKLVVRIALAPARGAFLLLVGLNFMGTATRLKKAFDTRASDTQNWWTKLGGNPNELLRKVNQGAKKKRILGLEDLQFASEGEIGVVDPATGSAAAAAVASPILIKLAEFLSKLGIEPKEIAEVGKKLLGDKVKSIVEKQIEKEDELEMIEENQVNKVVQQAEQMNSKMNYIPFVVGGAVLLYFVTKKK